ncbi:phage portal protein [Marinobacter bryozoorum]|uniref:phage portal protein n=1 Tax=Marinobacter bryozoorum TaxID=256324 RepID=UPI00200447AB|nr:phage portal protein [Marinobacter bryozoorum]MCK7542959.1 phage portal protein [Marinobacter bryozoorum]
MTNKHPPVMAFWQAGKPGNKAFRDKGDPGPNIANLANLRTARMRARDAVRNIPLASRAIDLDVTNIVGTGIVPRFEERPLSALWREFEDECDASGIYDIYGLQEAAVRAWRETGECFIRLRPRRASDGLAVPMQVELLEADMVPLQNFPILSNGNRIVQGVEFNGIGQRVAYWVHKQHPGDNYGLQVSQGELTRVPADRIIHIYEPLRPGQVRGFPPLATVLQRMQQKNDFDEATLERQKLASSLTAVFTRPVPETEGVDPITGESIDGREMAEIEPGSAYTLYPGEDVKFPSLPSLGGEYEAFARVNGRDIAAGFGLPYELLTGDFQGMSDRTVRVLINEYRRRVEQHQWHRVIRQMMRPIKAAWLTAAKLSGVARDSIDDTVRWVPPAWPYFHPVQDVQALTMEVKAGLRSQSDVIHSRGNDPDQVRRERAAEQADDQRAGVYSTTTVYDPEIERSSARARSDMVAQAEAQKARGAAMESVAASTANQAIAEANKAKAKALEAEARAHDAEEAMNRSADELNRLQGEIAKARAESEALAADDERKTRMEALVREIEAREQSTQREAEHRLELALHAAEEAREAREHARKLQKEDYRIKQLERQGAEQVLADLSDE